MGLRATIDRHPGWTSLVSIALAAIAGVSIYINQHPRPAALPPPTQETSDSRYFMDLGSGVLFAASRYDIPPIEVESEETLQDGRGGGARAQVFSCGDCADETQLIVGWLEIYTSPAADLQSKIISEAVEAGQPPRPLTPEEQAQAQAGLLVAKPEGRNSRWVPAGSAEGQAITSERPNCTEPKQVLRECYP